MSEAHACSRRRLLVVGAVLALAFLGVAMRLVELTVMVPDRPLLARAADAELRRADILDRNGEILATNIAVASVFADPRLVLDAEETATALAAALDGVEAERVRRQLEADSRFVWIKRHVTPQEREAVTYLGLPGVGFREEERRVYPKGPLAAHAVGFVNVDNQGLSGAELAFDDALRGGEAAGREPLRLSLDMRVQQVLREELQHAIARFRAKGGNGIVLDRRTGEVLAMVSLPDFDPNHARLAPAERRFNRNSRGTYEMGSLFKVFTIAMALDSGAVRITDSFDATEPLRIGRHTIRDYRPRRRTLTVPEIFMFSSNVGSARMAFAVGTEGQKAFLERIGMFGRPNLELVERAQPQLPPRWPEVTSATVAFGHGIAVTPLHVVEALAAMLGDGRHVPATLLPRRPDEVVPGEALIRPETADLVRWLMWLTVAEGTGGHAEVPGYLVGGKTGTADKVGPRGGYLHNAVMSSFVGAFPMDEPRYVVLAMLDEPQGDADTYYFRTGGWTAAPVVGRVIARIGPILGVPPVDHRVEDRFRDRLVVTETFNGRTQRRENAFAAVSAPR